MPNFAFKELVVRSFTLDHMHLTWEIENTELDPWDYDWYVERSESPKGPWDPMTAKFCDRYQFVDHEVNLLHRWRKLYYRLKSVERADVTNVAYSEAGCVGAKPDLVALEIRRLEEIAFREHIGRQCWLFPARTFGQHCPSCFDSVLQKRTRSNCPTCFDTGWAGGYMHPIEAWIQFDPNPKQTQLLPMGEHQHSATQARLSSFPPVKPRDILVEAENRRWRVSSSGGTQKLRAVVHQEISLIELVPGDIEFQLPIKVADPMTLTPAAERNFAWTPQ